MELPPAPRRGRPVSHRSRHAVLATAAELLDERGFGRFTIDEVARRSRVSKATIYKHWSSGFDLAVDAYGASVTAAVPVLPTGDAVADLRSQVVRLAAYYAGPHGRVAAELLAAGITHDGGPGLLRRKFFEVRRTETAALIEDGKAAGQLRADLDTELAIDLLFGPIVFRLFNGLGPLDERGAVQLGNLALGAVCEIGGGSPSPEKPCTGTVA